VKRQRVKKQGLNIPSIGHIDAYAMIVDLNQFTSMVAKAEEVDDLIAQFTRDALSGPIMEIEAEGGEVIAFMGDAILAVIPDHGDSVVKACFGIAKDTDRQCEYISNIQSDSKDVWPFAPGGPSVKVSIEYGRLDVSTIQSRFLGEHRLLIGSPINYAARINAAGKGNRCIVGPRAAQLAFSSYGLDGPQWVKGKRGEQSYEYYLFSMGDIWIEGPRRKGKRTSWK
jgi:class 3 adenylate cyclase